MITNLDKLVREKNKKSGKRKRIATEKNSVLERKNVKTTKFGKSDRKKSKKEENEITKKIESLTEGLVYISETDAEIHPYTGSFAKCVTGEILLKQLNLKPDLNIKKSDFEDFFRHPTKLQNWFDEKRIKQTKKYIKLKKFLEENLEDLTVFKIGETDLDIYVVGMDSESRLVGIKTKALET